MEAEKYYIKIVFIYAYKHKKPSHWGCQDAGWEDQHIMGMSWISFTCKDGTPKPVLGLGLKYLKLFASKSGNGFIFSQPHPLTQPPL